MKKTFLLLGLCFFFYTPACEGGVSYRSELAERLADEVRNAVRKMSRNDFPAAARRTAKDQPRFSLYHREMNAPPEEINGVASADQILNSLLQTLTDEIIRVASGIGFDIGEFYSQVKNLENIDEKSRVRIKIPVGILKPVKKPVQKPRPGNSSPQQSPPKDDSFVPDVSVGISADVEIPISGAAGDESNKETDY